MQIFFGDIKSLKIEYAVGLPDSNVELRVFDLFVLTEKGKGVLSDYKMVSYLVNGI